MGDKDYHLQTLEGLDFRSSSLKLLKDLVVSSVMYYICRNK